MTGSDGSPGAVRSLLPSADRLVLQFRWSPDSSLVAFVADRDADETYELYAVAPGGASPPFRISDPLAAGGNVTEFAWSPDGQRIAYRADQDSDERFELYTAPRLGGGSTRVSGPLVPAGNVAPGIGWSPDGTRIAYLADAFTDGLDLLFTTLPAAAGAETVVSDSALQTGSVVWFGWRPGGGLLAYCMSTAGGLDLFACPADTPVGGVKLTNPAMFGVTVIPPLWSPDGSRLAYQGRDGASTSLDLYTVRPDGSDKHLVAAFGSTTPSHRPVFSWAPPSSRLAYYRKPDVTIPEGPLHTALVDGSSDVLVGQADPDAVRAYDHRWSPDGTRIAQVAVDLSGTKVSLFVSAADGSWTVDVADPLVAGGSAVSKLLGWTADGARVVYGAAKDDATKIELYISRSDGTGDLKLSGPMVGGGRVEYFELR